MSPTRLFTYTSNTLIELSSDAVHNTWELGANANDRMGMACPSNECKSFDASISNILTKPSIDPQAKYLPSGLFDKFQIMLRS